MRVGGLGSVMIKVRVLLQFGGRAGGDYLLHLDPPNHAAIAQSVKPECVMHDTLSRIPKFNPRILGPTSVRVACIPRFRVGVTVSSLSVQIGQLKLDLIITLH